MLQINVWKRVNLALAVLASVVLYSCSDKEVLTPSQPAETNNVSAQATVNDPVRLLRATAITHYKYGAHYQRGFEIRIQNLSPTKKVFIHHKKKDGTWIDLAASYQGTLDAGYELWKSAYSENSETILASQFVVGYTVNGVTYYDNNNNANYTLPDSDGALLGRGYNVMLSNGGFASYSPYNFVVNIDVRNLAATKKVQVVYTTNNWASTTTANASFVSSYQIGYAYILSPNSIGFERWVLDIPSNGSTSIKYYLKYEVNGQVYYDNNFGRNYTATR